MTLPTTIAPGDPGHIGDHEEIHGLLAGVVAGSGFTVAQTKQGTYAGRPAAGTSGRYYFATDFGILLYDNGAAWQFVGARFIGCRVYRSAGLSINDASHTSVGFDAESFDTDAFHTGSATTLTAPLTGYYDLTAGFSFNGDAAGYREGIIQVNGSNHAIALLPPPGAADFYATIAGGRKLLSAGDTVSLDVFQNRGSALSLTAGVNATWLDVTFVRTA